MSDSNETSENVSAGHDENKDSESCSPVEPKTIHEVEHVEEHQQQSGGSPVFSCVSMKSDQSMEPPITIQEKDQQQDKFMSLQKESQGSSAQSCVSVQSNWSMDPLSNFNTADFSFKLREKRRELDGQSFLKQRTALDVKLRQVERKVVAFVRKEFKKLSRILNPDVSECAEGVPEEEEDAGDAKDATVKITLHILKSMKEQSLIDRLSQYQIYACQQKLKSSLKSRSQCVFEGIAKHGNQALLNKIYTELYITEGGSGEINNEHEVRQIETASRRPETQETPIRCCDIFKPLAAQDKPIRTVLTKGVAGIGKTVSVQKFILDWAEEKTNQDVHFIFPLPFRELNLIDKDQYTLAQLLHYFFKETSGLNLSNFENYKVIFIFDGLDECRLSLDFMNTKRCTDLNTAAPVNELLINLIKGNLLPSALLWITSRPAAANQIPPECVDQITEVRGFTDPQKDEYFRKRINDQSLADKIITHIKSSRSLYIMCHIPVFCWISATVLEKILGKTESQKIPKSLTEMYTHFLIFQILQMNKYNGQDQMDSNLSKDNILSLGKLAFQQLRKDNVIFYEEDLGECGIDIKDASLYSGLCTQIFKEEPGLCQRKVYCFMHLSFQEYLAALFVHLHWFTSQNPNSSEIRVSSRDIDFGELCVDSTLFDLHRSAVHQAVHSRNGHFDLFLRFLLGLSQEGNENLLRQLPLQFGNCTHDNETTIRYIKQSLGTNLSPEKSINLFHCLNELNDHSLVEEIQTYLSSGRLSSKELSRAQWSALVFVLLTSDEGLETFDLKKFCQKRSDDCLLKLHPVIKASRAAKLSSCNLTKECCAALSSVLESNPNLLRELDLSYNALEDLGVKRLCVGLMSPHCKLETLNLEFCNLRRESCFALVSALKSNPSQLKELNLSSNQVGNEAVTWLLGLLPDCRLETLRLSSCGVTKEACAFLASALSSKPCHLKRLDLSNNKLWDNGVSVFPSLLSNPYCNLEELRLESCNIKLKDCIFSLEGSRLKALDLSHNDLYDSGAKQLANSLKNPYCKLEKLRLRRCRLAERGFSSLASALRSNPYTLKELDLSSNFPERSGVKQLCAVLSESSCALQKLSLDSCDLSVEICSSVGTALSRNLILRELNLSNNTLTDQGVMLLFLGLRKDNSALKILKLSNCSVTDSGCECLASVLQSSCLMELDLSRNSISQQGELLLSSRSNINLSF